MGLRTNGDASQAAQNQNLIQCETRRRLAPVSFTASQLQTRDIPRDTVIKRMHLKLEGAFIPTYGSGSPTYSPSGMFERLCGRIDVVIDGQRTVKSISPAMQRGMNSIYFGNPPRRAYANPGATLTTNLGATEWVSGTVAYPSSTEYTIIEESICVHFEMPWAYDMGREATYLNVKSVSSADIRFNFGAFENLQTDGVGATVTYGTSTLAVVPTLVEARQIPSNQQFYDFKETVKRETITAEVRDKLIDLPRGNGLAGVMIQVKNGASSLALSDRGLRDIQLLVNGQQVLQRTTFHDLQDDNQLRFGCNDPRASSLHSLQGQAYMNLLLNGDIRTALNTSIGAGVDNVSLAVTSAPSSGIDAATYTNGMEVSVLSQEIAAVPAKI